VNTFPAKRSQQLELIWTRIAPKLARDVALVGGGATQLKISATAVMVLCLSSNLAKRGEIIMNGSKHMSTNLIYTVHRRFATEEAAARGLSNSL